MIEALFTVPNPDPMSVRSATACSPNSDESNANPIVFAGKVIVTVQVGGSYVSVAPSSCSRTGTSVVGGVTLGVVVVGMSRLTPVCDADSDVLTEAVVGGA